MKKELANDWVQKGLEICNELNNQEYKHHFTILKNTTHWYSRRLRKTQSLQALHILTVKNYTIMYKNITNY